MAAPVMPPSKPVDGRLRVWWVPTIADTSAPTVTEIEAGVDITCYLSESKAGIGKDQTTIPDRRMCSTTAMQVPGSGSATADDIVYIYDPQAAVGAPMNLAFDELGEDTEGHYVVRRGELYEVEAADGQFVEVQTCKNGVRWDSSAATEDFNKMTQKRFMSNFVEKATITAGA